MLVNGKTDEEYLQILNACLCADFINRNDKVLDNRLDNCIKIYCNKSLIVNAEMRIILLLT